MKFLRARQRTPAMHVMFAIDSSCSNSIIVPGIFSNLVTAKFESFFFRFITPGEKASIVVSGYSSQNQRPLSLLVYARPSYFIISIIKSIFVSAMGLLDLDKIIIKRTVIGIRCTSCGGNLLLTQKKSITSQLLKLISVGTINPKHYECENCKKRYVLL